MDKMPKREFHVRKAFAEADEADYAYYRSLSGDEKLKLMLEIMAPAYEANPRFERVYRVIESRGVECLLIGGWVFGFHATLPSDVCQQRLAISSVLRSNCHHETAACGCARQGSAQGFRPAI
jgi:hypothetical protein